MKKTITKNKKLPQSAGVKLSKTSRLSKQTPHPNERYSELATLHVGDALYVSGVKYNNIRRSLLRARQKYNYSFYSEDTKNGVNIWRVS